MSRLVPLAAIVLLCTLSVARADVYRWIDEKGVPHYSDQWVPGSTVIKTSKVRPDSDTLGQPRGPGNPADRANQVVADQSNAHAVQQDIAKSRDAQCKAATDRYMKSVVSRRVYKDGPDGARTYLSDAEADAYREGARKDVQSACGKVPEFDPNAPIPEPKPVPEPQVNPADATSE